MRELSWRFRVRTLLILVALAAVVLGVGRTVLRLYRAKSYRQQASSWAQDRARYQQLAEVSRSRGDGAAAAKRDRLAAYCEEWRRVLEDAASKGDLVMATSGPSAPK
jgi:hypothetical protein